MHWRKLSQRLEGMDLTVCVSEWVMHERVIEARLDRALMPVLRTVFEELAAEGREDLSNQGSPRWRVAERVHLRYEGTLR